jgi:hypothetical protein
MLFLAGGANNDFNEVTQRGEEFHGASDGKGSGCDTRQAAPPHKEAA